MSNIVFILGAGASKKCGAPLMANFLDVASNLLRTHRVYGKEAQFDRVFSAIGGLQAVHSKAQLDLNNIESIFTVLELGRVIKRIPGIDFDEIAAVISSLKELIVKTLEVTIPFPTNRGYLDAPKPYDSFAKLLTHLRKDAFPKQTVSVITFNYDIAVDMALSCEGLGPDYILEKPTNPEHPVPLMKLHGSLNWAIEKESSRIRPIHLNDYRGRYRGPGFDENGTIMVPIGSQLVEYFSNHFKIQVESEPVIVPPSWNKADYHQALSDVWAAAATNLSEADCIFIIGYSLPETDSFFRHLYALGSVGKAALRRLMVFNPDTSGETDTRFSALLGPGAKARYEYHPFTFEASIPFIKALFPSQQ